MTSGQSNLSVVLPFPELQGTGTRLRDLQDQDKKGAEY